MKRQLCMRAFICFAGLVSTVISVPRCGANESLDAQKAAAHAVQVQLPKIAMHSVGVPDFLDAGGKHSVLGQYLAANFSKALAEQGTAVAVASRVRLQSILERYQWSASDFANPEVATKFAVEMGVDAFVWGTISEEKGKYRILLRVRDASGKELLQLVYEQKIEGQILGITLTPVEEFGVRPNFAGLDGISQPKCKSCPAPAYTNSARAARIEGTNSFLVMINPAGKIDHIHLVRTLDRDLDDQGVKALKQWTMEASQDSAGSKVPAWVMIDVSLRFFE